ncbi:hypothetical protein [Amycolatopsis sp. cmx-8-4]|uniref:hypothetical protein n=1 Tax=Amycolatopsis sp. cmx-8-4 TaxID=2790947 RepID=UPI00397BE9B3
MVLRRCLVAGGAGVVAALTVTQVPTTGWCTGGGCVLLPVVLVPLVVLAAVLLAWAVMGVARVRRAWQVALGGPLVALALTATLSGMRTWPLVLYFPVVAACYVLAALVTSDALPQAWRVALVSPVVVLFGWGVLLPLLVPGL